MHRILVISENDVLIRNLFEWNKSKIKNGDLVIDCAKDRETAEKYMSDHSYDKIFHNGIYIFDIIEKLQSGSDVYNYGLTNNNYYSQQINPNDKKSFSRIFDKKWFQMGVNIGRYVTAAIVFLLFISSLVSFAWIMRQDIDTNLTQIKVIDGKVEKLETGQEKIKKDVKTLVTIMNVVYGEKVKTAINENEN